LPIYIFYRSELPFLSWFLLNFFGFYQFLFVALAIFHQLSYIACLSEDLDLENVLRPEPQRKNSTNSFNSGVRTDIFVDSFDHNSVKLNKLVHHLLIWLKLKLAHFVAKIYEHIVSKGRHDQSKHQGQVVYLLVLEGHRQRNTLQKLRINLIIHSQRVVFVANPCHWNSSDKDHEEEKSDASLDVVKVKVAVGVRQAKELFIVCTVKNLEEMRETCGKF